MELPLDTLLTLAGHPLSPEDEEKVRAYLAPYFKEVKKLRELDLPDEIEPVTELKMELWD